MNPRLRLFIVGGLGAIAAVYISVNIADEGYKLAGLTMVAIAWLLTERFCTAEPDAWVLAIILFGYVVGNRGFAQFFLVPDFPLLPAEAALLACTPALLLRLAFKQTPAIARDGLNLAIVAWMLYGTIRLPLDLHRYGFEALRDFATVYYASFFFITQALCRHDASRRLLQQSLLWAFALLPVASALFALYPDFFLTTLTWRACRSFITRTTSSRPSWPAVSFISGPGGRPAAVGRGSCPRPSACSCRPPSVHPAPRWSAPG